MRAIAFCLAAAFATSAAADAPPKVAYLFLSQHLTGSIRDDAIQRRIKEHAWFREQGYEPVDRNATDKEITDALWDGAPAIAFFGHGGSTDATGGPAPTFDSMDAAAWKSALKQDFLVRYLDTKRYTLEEAQRLADQRLQNLGLEVFKNFACYSSSNLSIAQLFVKPGGRYFGTRRVRIDGDPVLCAAACMCSFGYYRFSLTEYRMPDDHIKPGAEWLLASTNFEVFDPKTKTYVAGASGKTDTSEWWVTSDAFRFTSKLDGFALDASWTRPPPALTEGEAALLVVEAEARGPRKVQIGISPVGPICEWQLDLTKKANAAVERPLRFLKCGKAKASSSLRLELPASSGHLERQTGWMELEVTPRAKLVGSHVDALILELNCNGAAKVHWTYKRRGK
jgi:hypothetical protein